MTVLVRVDQCGVAIAVVHVLGQRLLDGGADVIRQCQCAVHADTRPSDEWGERSIGPRRQFVLPRRGFVSDIMNAFDMVRGCRSDPAPSSGAPCSRKQLEHQLSNQGRSMRVWQCIICGFEYDEEEGLPEEDIPPGTKWEDLPDDWTCPDCGAPKEDFELIDED